MTLKQKLTANKTAFGTCGISTSPHFVNGTKVYEAKYAQKLDLFTFNRIHIVPYNENFITIAKF